MKKKILIIGFGSIGIRHAKILSNFKEVNKIAIFTGQKQIKLKKTIFIKKLNIFNPDYIIICSETSNHYSDILKVEKNFKNKIVLVEKPLFERYRKIQIKKNKYFLGYNLRFHPIIEYIKKRIKKNKIFSINIFCSSFLPFWRKNRNYANTYSGKKNGGGVLLDLSHELDYLQWLFGNITKVNYLQSNKISKLKINVEDNFTLIGKIKNLHFNLNVNFFSRSNQRLITLDAGEFSIKADLLKNTIYLFNKNKIKKINFSINEDFTYAKQHKLIINKDYKDLCRYKEGLELVKFVDKLKKKIK